MKNACMSIIFIVASGVVAQNPGEVDSDFGPNGTGFIVVPIPSASTSEGFALTIDAQGRILLAGPSFFALTENDFTVVRFSAEGIVDTTFGPNGNGIFTLNLTPGASEDVARAVVLDQESRILVGGYTDFSNFGLIRLSSDGLLDLSFGPSNTGIVTFSTGVVGIDQAYAMVLDSQQRILLGGDGIGATPDFLLTRFTPNGILDSSFGPNGTGFVTVDMSGGGSIDFARALILDKQEKILMGGISGFSFAVVRFSPDGVLDTTFGPNNAGFVLLRFGDNLIQERVKGMVVDSQGRIVIAGATNFNGTGGGSFDPTDFLVARFTSDGIIDSSFGPNQTGFVSVDFSGDGTSNDVANALAIDSRGRFVVAGFSDVNGSNSFVLARFTQDGVLDTSFGTNETGFIVFDFSGDNSSVDVANALGLDSGGGVLLGGRSTLVGGVNQFALARFFGEQFNTCALGLREKYCFLP